MDESRELAKTECPWCETDDEVEGIHFIKVYRFGVLFYFCNRCFRAFMNQHFAHGPMRTLSLQKVQEYNGLLHRFEKGLEKGLTQ